MGRTAEEPIPTDEHYVGVLLASLRKALSGGSQTTVAEQLGLTQGSISRLASVEGPKTRLTYTTLVKLARMFKAPSPVVPVRDADHELWCKLGAILAERNPDVFRRLLAEARSEVVALGVSIADLDHREAAKAATAEMVEDLKSVIAHPLPGKARRRRGKSDRGS